MSVTYRALLNSVVAAFAEVGADFSAASPAAPSRTAPRVAAGTASKTVATMVRLDINQQGVGAERGDSKTGGVLVVKLSPSKATNDVAIDALSELCDQGHRALIHLDGKLGVRVSNVDVSISQTGIQLTARLAFGHAITATDAPNSLKGVA